LAVTRGVEPLAPLACTLAFVDCCLESFSALFTLRKLYTHTAILQQEGWFFRTYVGYVMALLTPVFPRMINPQRIINHRTLTRNHSGLLQTQVLCTLRLVEYYRMLAPPPILRMWRSLENVTAVITKKEAQDKCGFKTIEVFKTRWQPDATMIERKLHLMLPIRSDTNTDEGTDTDTDDGHDEYKLGNPVCWRAPGNAAVAPLGGRKHRNKRRLHRVFFTFSSTTAGMLADGKVQVNYPADGW
jgi:hypothetical protein